MAYPAVVQWPPMDLEPLPPESAPSEPEPQPSRPTFSRGTKLAGGALARATFAAGGWIVGSRLSSSHSTVRLQPAAASSTNQSGSPSTPGSHMFKRGVSGTVASIGADSFTVTVPARHRPDGSTTTTTAPPTSVTVEVTGATTYSVVQTGTFSASDAPVGARVAARGTRASNGDLTASAISVLPATAAAPGPAKTPPPGMTDRMAQAPMVFGTVKAVSGSPATITVTTPWGSTETVVATATTTVLKEVPAAFSAIKTGARVLVRSTSASTASGPVTAASVVIIPAGTNLPAGAGRWSGMGPGRMGPGMMGPGFAHRFGGPGREAPGNGQAA